MATCDPQALLNAANCFDCLNPLQLEQVQVQMLCDLVNEGLAGGPFVKKSGDTMTGSLKILSPGKLALGSDPAGVLSAFYFNQANDDGYITWYTNGVFKNGIGTTFNAGSLINESTAGDFCIRSQSILRFASGGSAQKMVMLSNGNVGIGVITPLNPLSVVADIDPANDVTYPISFGSKTTPAKHVVMGYDVAGDAALFNGVETGVGWKNVSIASQGGNVGIGTKSPQSRMDVFGNLTIGSTYAGNNAAPTSGVIIEGRTGIGTNAPNANALLDLVSTTLGFKLPTMTSAQKGAIANTAGLMVFDTDLGKACVNNGAGWQTITSV